MKIDLKKTTNTELMKMLYKKYDRNWVQLNDEYKLAIDYNTKSVMLTKEGSNKLLVRNRKELIDFLEKNNIEIIV